MHRGKTRTDMRCLDDEGRLGEDVRVRHAHGGVLCGVGRRYGPGTDPWHPLGAREPAMTEVGRGTAP
jgi:hypothetical protein